MGAYADGEAQSRQNGEFQNQSPIAENQTSELLTPNLIPAKTNSYKLEINSCKALSDYYNVGRLSLFTPEFNDPSLKDAGSEEQNKKTTQNLINTIRLFPGNPIVSFPHMSIYSATSSKIVTSRPVLISAPKEEMLHLLSIELDTGKPLISDALFIQNYIDTLWNRLLEGKPQVATQYQTNLRSYLISAQNIAAENTFGHPNESYVSSILSLNQTNYGELLSALSASSPVRFQTNYYQFMKTRYEKLSPSNSNLLLNLDASYSQVTKNFNKLKNNVSDINTWDQRIANGGLMAGYLALAKAVSGDENALGRWKNSLPQQALVSSVDNTIKAYDKFYDSYTNLKNSILRYPENQYLISQKMLEYQASFANLQVAAFDTQIKAAHFEKTGAEYIMGWANSIMDAALPFAVISLATAAGKGVMFGIQSGTKALWQTAKIALPQLAKANLKVAAGFTIAEVAGRLEEISSLQGAFNSFEKDKQKTIESMNLLFQIQYKSYISSGMRSGQMDAMFAEANGSLQKLKNMNFEKVEGLSISEVALTFMQVYAISFAFTAGHRFSRTFDMSKAWGKQFSSAEPTKNIKLFKSMLEQTKKANRKNPTAVGFKELESQIELYLRMSTEGKTIPTENFNDLSARTSDYIYRTATAKPKKNRQARKTKPNKAKDVRSVPNEQMAKDLKKDTAHGVKNLIFNAMQGAENIVDNLRASNHSSAQKIQTEYTNLQNYSNRSIEIFKELNPDKIGRAPMIRQLAELQELSADYQVLQNRLSGVNLNELKTPQIRKLIADITAESKNTSPDVYEVISPINAKANPKQLSQAETNARITELEALAVKSVRAIENIENTLKGENIAEVAQLTAQKQKIIAEKNKISEVSGEYEFSAQDIGQQISRIINSNYPEVTVELPQRRLFAITNQTLLEKMLKNVIPNALKYSPDGVPVRVKVFATKGKVKIQVINKLKSGAKDLTPLEAENAFSGVKNENATAASTGFGLPLSRSLAVEMFNGNLRHIKGNGRTTTFEIEIPLAKRPKIRTARMAPDLAPLSEASIWMIKGPGIDIKPVSGYSRIEYNFIISKEKPTPQLLKKLNIEPDSEIIRADFPPEFSRQYARRYENLDGWSGYIEFVVNPNKTATAEFYYPKSNPGGENPTLFYDVPGLGYVLEKRAAQDLIAKEEVTSFNSASRDMIDAMEMDGTATPNSEARIHQLKKANVPVNENVSPEQWLAGMNRGIRAATNKMANTPKRAKPSDYGMGNLYSGIDPFAAYRATRDLTKAVKNKFTNSPANQANAQSAYTKGRQEIFRNPGIIIDEKIKGTSGENYKKTYDSKGDFAKSQKTYLTDPWAKTIGTVTRTETGFVFQNLYKDGVLIIDTRGKAIRLNSIGKSAHITPGSVIYRGTVGKERYHFNGTNFIPRDVYNGSMELVGDKNNPMGTMFRVDGKDVVIDHSSSGTTVQRGAKVYTVSQNSANSNMMYVQDGDVVTFGGMKEFKYVFENGRFTDYAHWMRQKQKAREAGQSNRTNQRTRQKANQSSSGGKYSNYNWKDYGSKEQTGSKSTGGSKRGFKEEKSTRSKSSGKNNGGFKENNFANKKTGRAPTFKPAEGYENFYDLIELPQNSTPAQIKSKLNQMIKNYHPDTSPLVKKGIIDEKFANDMTVKLNKAREILLDPQKRASYNKTGKYK